MDYGGGFTVRSSAVLIYDGQYIGEWSGPTTNARIGALLTRSPILAGGIELI